MIFFIFILIFDRKKPAIINFYFLTLKNIQKELHETKFDILIIGKGINGDSYGNWLTSIRLKIYDILTTVEELPKHLLKELLVCFRS